MGGLALSPFDLEGKIALVTGGTGAIGGAIAAGLASAGAHVVVAGRHEEKLEAACAAITAAGGTASSCAVDLSEYAQIGAAFESVYDRHGRLDVLVNAAGAQLRKPALEIESGDWRALMDVNLDAVFFCCQAAARMMAHARDGRIINVTSLAAEIGLPHLAAYGASKGAIKQLTMALAVEWAPLGIRVNAIGPGRVRTPMTESLFQDEPTREAFLRLIPLGRAGLPEEMAGAAVFLASDASAYLTGQTIYVDGGWLAGGGNPPR